jgi:hypothetical protein
MAFFVVGLDLRQHVGLPHLRPGGRVERDHAAAELAALVGGHGAGGFLARGHAHVDAPVVIGDRPAHAADGEVVHVGLPQELPGRGVERVDDGRAIAEEGDVTGADPPDTHRRPHALAGVVEPVNAAAGGAERVDRASPAADENAPARDAGL